MSYTLDELRAKKREVMSRLESELRTHFNNAHLIVTAGITKNASGAPDLVISIQDLAITGDVGADIVDYARDKVQEWEPDLQPKVRAMKPVFAQRAP